MFELPPELVAQHPAPERDASRLMVVSPDGGREDLRFSNLTECLRPGDLLVRNNVRVMPARLVGKRRGGGAAELLLVRKEDGDGVERWLCLARPTNKFTEGREFLFGDGELIATPRGNGGDGMVWAEFSLKGAEFMDALERVGQIPLPPYIERAGKPTVEDAARYQTVYAKQPGAVAAPTAGLHFTPSVDAALAARGIGVCEITLNVGPGTFRPIKAENLDDHVMHSEWYDVSEETWRRVGETKRAGGRVVAVGTTTARTLEAAAGTGKRSGWTELFIRPGYGFKIIDGLVTNFHLPGSSLLVMISALAGRERVLACYEDAVRGEWRFYSYGDAMLIWGKD
jgi:S-adenosylmethionine:tRNA ribosyltransferase-isomerase